MDKQQRERVRKKKKRRWRETQEERSQHWYCLQASWDATQFHSFTSEWHSIWMQPLWQPLCITTYQRWYSQSASILVQHYVKQQLRMSEPPTQESVSPFTWTEENQCLLTETVLYLSRTSCSNLSRNLKSQISYGWFVCLLGEGETNR